MTTHYLITERGMGVLSAALSWYDAREKHKESVMGGGSNSAMYRAEQAKLFHDEALFALIQSHKPTP